MCLGNRVFFFNDTATTEICTLSLHDALPISAALRGARAMPLHLDRLLERRPVDPVDQRLGDRAERLVRDRVEAPLVDRKSTRLNSSHANISYAVFCL